MANHIILNKVLKIPENMTCKITMDKHILIYYPKRFIKVNNASEEFICLLGCILKPQFLQEKFTTENFVSAFKESGSSLR